MEPFPFFRRPYYYYDPNRYINQYNAQNRAYPREQINQRQVEQREYASQADKKTDSKFRQSQSQIKTNIPSQKQEIFRFQGQEQLKDDFFLEIFGIKLYFDDILIIALIFFLYSEGVQDNFLFISLILLLLS